MLTLEEINQILNTLQIAEDDYVEIFYEKTRHTRASIEDQKVDEVITGVDSGIGLRIIHNDKTAFGCTNNLEISNLLSLAQFLKGSFEEKDVNAGTLDHKQKKFIDSPHKRQIDPLSISLIDKVDLLRKLEEQTRKKDSRIVQVETSYSDSLREILIANNEGVTQTQQHHIIISATVTVYDGTDYHTGDHTLGGLLGYEFITQEVLDELSEKAVKRALLTMTSEASLNGVYPVVISSKAGGTFVHEALGHGLEADLVCGNMSVYEGKLGQQIASDKVSIVDDPTLTGKRGSFGIDDEGVPSEKTILVENGILKNYLCDRLSAKKLGLPPNGHGRRESFEHRPIPRMSNTMMLAGQDNPDEIVQSVKKGLFVKSMGGGQVNTINGDFVFEVLEGNIIENGVIGEPISGATISGNGPKVLKSIDRIAWDLGFSIGTCGKEGQDAPVTDAMPTIRIPKMTIGSIGSLESTHIDKSQEDSL